jgi:hypothetical protein
MEIRGWAVRSKDGSPGEGKALLDAIFVRGMHHDRGGRRPALRALAGEQVALAARLRRICRRR